MARQLTASQKIARLEYRIARLEKEAGVFKDVAKAVGRGALKGLDKTTQFFGIKNLAIKLFNVLADAFRSTQLLVEDSQEVINNALGGQLQSRIHRAMTGVIFSNEDIPYLVKNGYNPKKPIKSLFTGGRAEKRVVPLDKLSEMYRGETRKRLKRGYLSWHEDYSHIFEETSKKEDLDGFLRMLKSIGGYFYRAFTAVLGVIGIKQVLTSKFSLVMLALGGAYLKTKGIVMAKPAPDFKFETTIPTQEILKKI